MALIDGRSTACRAFVREPANGEGCPKIFDPADPGCVIGWELEQPRCSEPQRLEFLTRRQPDFMGTLWRQTDHDAGTGNTIRLVPPSPEPVDVELDTTAVVACPYGGAVAWLDRVLFPAPASGTVPSKGYALTQDCRRIGPELQIFPGAHGIQAHVLVSAYHTISSFDVRTMERYLPDMPTIPL